MKPIGGPNLFLYSIILLLAAGCATRKAGQSNADKPLLITTRSADSFDDTNDPLKHMRDQFLVTAIDSTDKLYQLYGRYPSDTSLYKIVSQRTNTECRDIQVGNSYSFITRSLTAPITIGDMVINVRQTPHVAGIVCFNTIVMLELNKVKDVLIAENLSGLCLTDKNKLLQLRQPNHQP